MVKALHKAGIGVILDVVLNHTAEAGAEGPVIGLKGLANEEFYLLDAEDKTKYLDFTGCGNTVRCNDSFVTRFMVDCLTFWVREMHVDGFRFDLASALARGVDGEPVADPPIVASIEFAEALADTRLIAEPWDAVGYYQLGNWPGFRWAEWNGRYRDSLRRFLRGEPGLLGEVATRLAGSSDFFASAGKAPGERRELHHLSRRLHALGPRELRPQAQRGERRGQPRWARRQLQLELRRRRRNRRRRDTPAARAARAQRGRCCCS